MSSSAGALAALALLLAPAPLPAQAPQEPPPGWLEAELRDAYVRHLRESPGDPVAWSAADFLLSSSAPIRLGALPASYLGKKPLAAYAAHEDVLLIDPSHFRGTRFDPALGPGALREQIAPFVERSASVLVHEIRHALSARETGPSPPFLESEVTANADEALFLWSRLERDKGYRGLGALDAAVRRLTGEPPAPGSWWKDPLEPEDASRLARMGEAALASAGVPGLSGLDVNSWFVARAAAAGLDRLPASLKAAGLVLAELYPIAQAEGRRRAEFAQTRKALAFLRSRQSVKEGLDPKEIPSLIRRHEELLSFWEEPRRLARARAHYQALLAEQESRLKALRGP